MIKIKRTKLTFDADFEHFLLNIFDEWPEQHNFILDFFHGFLPNEQKLWSENYAAIEEKKSFCEVSISPQSRKNARWQINKLSVGNCSDEIISRLIKYVMNKYGGDGVQTFITFIKDDLPELKELFKKGCSFRECAHLELWKGIHTEKSQEDEAIIFNDYNPKYLPQIVELHNNMIFPQFRQALKIEKKDFQKRFKNASLKKILLNPSTNSIEGYFLIFSKNNKLYLELLMSDAFATYYPEILDYCKNYTDNINILVKKYHTSSKNLVDYLSQKDFKKSDSYAILVKDYWSPVKKENESILSLRVNVNSPA